MNAVATPESASSRILAEDGRPLMTTFFPAAGPARGALLVLSALGVPRGYYGRFAKAAAAAGYATLTGDYRGTGDSLLPVPGNAKARLRADDATLRDWADRDAPALLGALTARAPGVPVHVVGHSFGGQAIPLLAAAGLRFASATIVAAGTGDLARYPRLLAARYRAQFALLGPVIEGLGWVPPWLGLGMGLPKGVVTTWARWCRTPGYYRRDYGDLAPGPVTDGGPVRFFDAADDRIAPAGATADLRRLVTGPVEYRVLTPARGGAAIGHFGFFRDEALFRAAIPG